MPNDVRGDPAGVRGSCVWRGMVAVHALAFLSVGCGVGDRNDVSSRSDVRDSAGVRITENRESASTAVAAWELSPEPTWVVGANPKDSTYEFSGVTGIALLADGRVAIADGGSSQIRFFDNDARFVHAVGRRGAGPGEFRALSALHSSPDDSLVALDMGTRRISVFDERGTLARTFMTPQVGDASVLMLAGVFDSGDFLYHSLPIMGGTAAPPGVVRIPTVLYRSDRDGNELVKLGEFPGFDVLVSEANGQPMSGLQAFGRQGVVAATGDGFVYGPADQYEIHRFDMSGTLIRVIRRDHHARAVDPRHVQHVIDRIREQMPDGPMRDNFVARAGSAAKSFPPYQHLNIDAAGRLWVGSYVAPPDQLRTWEIFDTEGKLIGALSAPASLMVHRVGRDFLIGVNKDELGAERVEKFPLPSALVQR